ncbi:hypothetical protein FBY35_5230 [Streptomyces sp. SLBN-118]|nr:hypothetical protein FBY35_5230 [Streptomyces sp. SLBN-118]
MMRDHMGRPDRGSGGCPPGRHSLELTGKELRS